ARWWLAAFGAVPTACPSSPSSTISSTSIPGTPTPGSISLLARFTTISPKGRLARHRLQLHLEMPQERDAFHDAVPGDPLGVACDVGENPADVLDVALRIDPPRDRQPHQLVRGDNQRLTVLVLLAEGEGPQLRGADAPFQIERARQRVPGEPVRRDVRQQAASVEVDRVEPRGLDDRHTG